jgi:hypothetical protein
MNGCWRSVLVQPRVHEGGVRSERCKGEVLYFFQCNPKSYMLIKQKKWVWDGTAPSGLYIALPLPKHHNIPCVDHVRHMTTPGRQLVGHGNFTICDVVFPIKMPRQKKHVGISSAENKKCILTPEP